MYTPEHDNTENKLRINSLIPMLYFYLSMKFQLLVIQNLI